MKASELMLGDLVLYEYNGEKIHARVIEIYRSSALVESVSKEYEPIEIAEDKLFPIAITPEILEKNGFMQLEGCEKEDSVFYALSDMFAKIRWNGEKITDAVFGENILYFPAKRGLRYVHELQHALHLCGIEKDIEL